MEDFTIFRDGEKNLKFMGDLVASSSSSPDSSSSYYSGSNGRWSVMKLYKTQAGKFICQLIGRTQWSGEKDRYSGAVCATEAEVIEFFGHGDLAKDLYVGAGIDDAESVA